VIEVTNVSKKFRIWEDRNLSLKETVIHLLKGRRRPYRELWALRGIQFSIKDGETVAFIGENGSGKSTLLKLLGGILVPDEGKIVTHGKISSLLELGVGFHPDLTGEENIYLNGSMLGFNRREMRTRFDEIVSFAEIGDFIYSPIRTYSSGMAMRLGFSIAMCVDPDILLIDEVLAVGDEAFQKKCLKRLEEFKTSGKTIVIVSHSSELVRKFCERVILLQEGKLVAEGAPDSTVDKYHALLSDKERLPVEERASEEETAPEETGHEIDAVATEEDRAGATEKEEPPAARAPLTPKFERHGTFEAEIVDVRLRNGLGEETDAFVTSERMSIDLKMVFRQDLPDPIAGIYIRKLEDGLFVEIYGMNTKWRDIELGPVKKGERLGVRFTQCLPLPEGVYYLFAAIADAEGITFYDWQENVRSFTIQHQDPPWAGMVNLNSEIEILHD